MVGRLQTLLAGMVALAALPAAACGVLSQASPAVGSTGPAQPQLTLTFSEALVPADSSVTLSDAAGKALPLRQPSFNSTATVLTQPTPALAPGSYRVHWIAHWLDCDSRTDGHFPFTVSAR